MRVRPAGAGRKTQKLQLKSVLLRSDFSPTSIDVYEMQQSTCQVPVASLGRVPAAAWRLHRPATAVVTCAAQPSTNSKAQPRGRGRQQQVGGWVAVCRALNSSACASAAPAADLTPTAASRTCLLQLAVQPPAPAAGAAPAEVGGSPVKMPPDNSHHNGVALQQAAPPQVQQQQQQQAPVVLIARPLPRVLLVHCGACRLFSVLLLPALP